jgi:hypothetical protein
VTAIVALSVTVALLYREVGPLRQEVRKLRDEVGHLSISDPTKLHAIRVDTSEELTWKWRLWIPEEQGYRLRSYEGEVPKSGYPSSGVTISRLKSGETWIDYRIRSDPKSGKLCGAMRMPGFRAGGDSHDWVQWPRKRSTLDGVTSSTHVFVPGQTVELIRLRVSKDAASAQDIEDPAAGFMIWLEPIK